MPALRQDKPAALGTVAQPASGAVYLDARFDNFPYFSLTFTIDKARVPVTDGGASGSSGTLKIFDFNQGGISFLGCRQDFTAFAEGSALTTGAGDAVHVLGIGTTSATTARDGTLTGNEQNVGNLTAQVTNVAGTGATTKFTGAATASVDGTATALDIYLNWSGTAASIDANSTIDVTGTVTLTGVFIGDD